MGAALQSWGPGLIGLMVAIALYGVSIGQCIFYTKAFPHDLIQLKSLVYIVFFLDNAQSLTVIRAYYHILIDCRWNDSPGCAVYLPQSLVLSTCLIYWVTFMVQSFYAHRVWIISNRNRIITFAVCVFACAQLVFGLLGVARLIQSPTYQVVLTNKFSPLSAMASALCDAIITTSIYYYFRLARTVTDRRSNYIKKLNFIFVQMGLLSFINALAVAVTYCIEDESLSQLLIAAPGVILSKTYVNSMFGVLNARKTIREEREAQAQRDIESLTIPTIR